MRTLQTRRTASIPENMEVTTSIFPTEIGWIGTVGHGQTIVSLVVGYPSERSTRDRLKKSIDEVSQEPQKKFGETDWYPELRESLQRYAAGEQVDFGRFRLQLPTLTVFQENVLKVTRSLGYGQTTTYGELARKVGHPGAARAVGTVMSTNRFPIVIPCHRVLAAGGRLGGYTSPQGVKLKERLLEMEQS